MTDKVTVTEEAKELVRLAIETTPPHANDWEFRVAVRGRIPTLAHMLSDGSVEAVRAQKLLESKYVTGTILSIEIEEATQRGLVTIRGREGSDNETEDFRTERQDTPWGKEQIEALRRYVGVECLFMLWLEPATSKKNKSIRQMQHFVPHGKPTSGSASRESAQAPRHQTQSAPAVDPVIAASKAISEKLSAAGGMLLVRYAQRVREELGVTNVLNVGADNLEPCKAIAREIFDAESKPVAADVVEHFPGATYEEEQ